jgi:hypothetical protein
MRRTIPLLIVFFTGVIMFIQYFIPHYPFNKLSDVILEWVKIIVVFAMFLGILNLLRMNMIKISRRRHGWQYSVVLIIALLTTIALGLWQGVAESIDRVVYKSKIVNGKEKVLQTAKYTLNQIRTAKFRVIKEDDQKITDNSGKVVKIVKTYNGVMTIKDGSKIVAIYKGAKMAKKVVAEDLKTGEKTVKYIVPQITPGHWIYKNMIENLSSTMFSLLAFFIASAAFRAFRAKSFEASLLLIAAFIVMLGKIPLGEYMVPGISSLQQWIMNYLNTAGQRAILIGAAIGIVAISIKIIIGMERSYFGGK